MKIKITNFLAIKSAELEFKPGLTVIGGPNNNGKTTILHAITVACRPDQVSLGMTKAELFKAVHHGTVEGRIEATGPLGTATVSYPKGIRLVMPAWAVNPFSENKIPGIALGLVDWGNLKDTERMRHMTTVLADQITVTMDDLIGLGLDQASAGLAMYYMQMGDPEKAVMEAWSVERGRWKGVTKENHGSDKAKDFCPPFWTGVDVDEKAINDRLTAAIGSRAVDRSEEEKIEIAIAGKSVIDTLELLKAKEDAQQAVNDANENIKNIKHFLKYESQTEIDKLEYPLPDLKDNLESKRAVLAAIAGRKVISNPVCPSCNTELIVESYHPVGVYRLILPGSDQDPSNKIASINVDIAAIEAKIKTADDSIAALEKRREDLYTEKIAVANTTISAAKIKLNDVTTALEEAENHNNTLAQNKTRLAAIKNRPAGTVTEEQIIAIRAELAQAQKVNAANKIKLQADDIQAEIVRLDKIKAVVGPNGIRRTKLAKVIADLNKKMKYYSDRAGWRIAQLNENYQLTMDGFLRLGESEYWKANTVFQLVMAEVERSPIVLIDGADVVTADTRQKMLEMLTDTPIEHVIVTMAGSRAMADTIAKRMGIPAVWVEGGVTEAVEAVETNF